MNSNSLGMSAWLLASALMASAAATAKDPEKPSDKEAKDETGQLETKQKDAELLFYNLSESLIPLPNRIVKKPPQQVVVSVDGCVVSDVKFSEDERKSRISEDLTKAIKAASGDKAKARAAAAADGVCNSSREGLKKQKDYAYQLQHVRGTVTVTALSSDGETVLETKKVTTGPKEHWYLSLNLPVINRSTLKYDSGSASLHPKSDTQQLYLGVDYVLADVLDPPDNFGSEWYKQFGFKFMMLASKKPLNSVGTALSYNLPPLVGGRLGAFSIFGGHFWTKQDKVEAGVVDENSVYDGSWRVGISYSLDDAVQWVSL